MIYICTGKNVLLKRSVQHLIGSAVFLIMVKDMMLTEEAQSPKVLFVVVLHQTVITRHGTFTTIFIRPGTSNMPCVTYVFLTHKDK